MPGEGEPTGLPCEDRDLGAFRAIEKGYQEQDEPVEVTSSEIRYLAARSSADGWSNPNAA